MATERKVKSLGAGRLKRDSSALYIAPALTYAEVFKVTLAASQAVTVNIYHQIGPNIYRLTPENLPIEAGGLVELTDLTLSPEEMLVGFASVSNVVDYTVNGSEER